MIGSLIVLVISFIVFVGISSYNPGKSIFDK